MRFFLAISLTFVLSVGVHAQDLASVSVCLFPEDGAHPGKALVEFLDPDVDSPTVQTDLYGNLLRYELEGSRCVSGAGVVGTEGIPVMPETSKMVAYPNPGRDRTTLQWSTEVPVQGRIRVVDLLGREVITSGSMPLNRGIHEADVDLHSLPAGHYVAQLISDQGRILSQGMFTDVGGGSGEPAIVVRANATPSKSGHASESKREPLSAKRSSGEVRVRVVAEGYRVVDERFSSVVDGQELDVQLPVAPQLEIHTINMTDHHATIDTGTLTLIHRDTGFIYQVPVENGKAVTTVPAFNMEVHLEAAGFSNVQAVRLGAPGDYSKRLLGLNFGPGNASSWVYIPEDAEGPLTLAALPEQFVTDGHWDDYVARFSARALRPVWWVNSGHLTVDLESDNMKSSADTSDAGHRVHPVYFFHPVPSSALQDTLALALDALAEVVRERTFYRYEFKTLNSNRSLSSWGVSVEDSTVTGTGDFHITFYPADGNLLAGLLYPDANLDFPVGSEVQGVTDSTQHTVDGMMALIINMRMMGDDRVDDSDPANRTRFMDGRNWTPWVYDVMAIQAFIGRTHWGEVYDPDYYFEDHHGEVYGPWLSGAFHTVASPAGKRSESANQSGPVPIRDVPVGLIGSGAPFK